MALEKWNLKFRAFASGYRKREPKVSLEANEKGARADPRWVVLEELPVLRRSLFLELVIVCRGRGNSESHGVKIEGWGAKCFLSGFRLVYQMSKLLWKINRQSKYEQMWNIM